MDFEVSFQAAALFFCFAFGGLFGTLLLARGVRQDHPPAKWLGTFVLLACGYLVPFIFGYSGWYGRDGYREFLFFVPFQQFFFLGPVVYFYTRSLLEGHHRPRGRERWHFLPGLLYLVYSLVVFLTDVFILDDFYFYADGRDKDLAPWYQITGLTAMIVYFALSLRVYRRYRHRIFNELSYADMVVFGWVRQYLLALLAMMGLRIIFLFLLPNFGEFGHWFWYYLGFGALTCFISLAGYLNTVRLLAVPDPLAERRAPRPPVDAPSAAPEALRQELIRLMEGGKLYENPTLTLTDVAERLGVTSKQVSTLINRGFDQNFNDFVNGYRIEAVKRAFARGEHERFTILGVALASGFNSKTTFNRVFKRLEARTPVQYLERLSQEGHQKGTTS